MIKRKLKKTKKLKKYRTKKKTCCDTTRKIITVSETVIVRRNGKIVKTFASENQRSYEFSLDIAAY